MESGVQCLRVFGAARYIDELWKGRTSADGNSRILHRELLLPEMPSPSGPLEGSLKAREPCSSRRPLPRLLRCAARLRGLSAEDLKAVERMSG